MGDTANCCARAAGGPAAAPARPVMNSRRLMAAAGLADGIVSVQTSALMSRATATRVTPGAICLSSSSHFIASLHSITSSAVNSSLGGTSSPSAFDALRLLRSSNLLGARIGNTAGFGGRLVRQCSGRLVGMPKRKCSAHGQARSARRNLAAIQMERNQALEIFRTEGFHYAA